MDELTERREPDCVTDNDCVPNDLLTAFPLKPPNRGGVAAHTNCAARESSKELLDVISQT